MKNKKEIEEKASEYVDSVRNRIDSYAYLDVQEAFQKGAEWIQEQANGAEQSDSNCNKPLVSNRRELLIAVLKTVKGITIPETDEQIEKFVEQYSN